MKEEKKQGRPKIKDEKKRNYHIFVNLNQLQKERIQVIAENTGLSLSHICIQALKAQKVI